MMLRDGLRVLGLVLLGVAIGVLAMHVGRPRSEPTPCCCWTTGEASETVVGVPLKYRDLCRDGEIVAVTAERIECVPAKSRAR